MHNKRLNGWVECHVGKGFVTQRAAKSQSDCSISYTDKQFRFLRAFPEESVGICELYLFDKGIG
jgi:hypothetical protein